MKPHSIVVVDRTTAQKEEEKIYGLSALEFLYSGTSVARLLLFLTARLPLFSWLYGLSMKFPLSKRKIAPFVATYGVNPNEFQKEPSQFTSFNDFFIRKLKSSARPIAQGSDVAVMPCDGRYLFYPHMEEADGFIVKGKKFSLAKFLNDEKLAAHYAQGSLLIARLCPSDYHRFHFPVACIPAAPKPLPGHLYTVNPIALRRHIDFMTENKRIVTQLTTDHFGNIQYIEVGATCVGTIHQTFTPFQYYQKGAEKGYFSFGGSTIALLFEKNRLQIEPDLLALSQNHTEVICKMGQPLGKIGTKK